MSQAVRKQAANRDAPRILQSPKYAQTAMPSTLAAKRQAQQAEHHELLAREFGLVASAPNGIKKLREMILALAVRGKLVPQNPDDVSAGKVFGVIASTSGKSQLKEVTEQDSPYVLPKGWLWMRLGIATSFGSNEKAGRLYSETWVLDLEDIEKDTSKLLRKLRYAERPAKSEKNLFHSGDVLYGKLRPYLNKVIVADENGACTTEILPIRWNASGDPKFLMYALKSPDFLAYVNSKSYGMKMPRLGTMDGRNALIPVPPVEEQKRITSKIDELMVLCDRMEAQQADADAAHKTLVKTLLDALTQSQDAADFNASWARISENFDTLFNTEEAIDNLKSVLLELSITGKLTSHGENEQHETSAGKHILPRNWGWEKLGDIADLITKGSSPKWQGVQYTENPDDVLFITSENVRNFQIDIQSPKYVQKKFNEIEPRSILKEGDFLMNIVGASIGRTALFNLTVTANINQAVCLIRISSEKFDKQYLLNFFNSRTCINYMFDKQVDNARANLSMGNIAKFLVPVPPTAEQRRIVAKVDELMAICDTLKTRITESKTLHEQLANALVKQGAAGV